MVSGLTHHLEKRGNFFSGSGLNVTTYVAEPGSLKEVWKKGVRKRGDYHFSGKCRYDFRKAVRRDYSYFLFSENDMNITLNHSLNGLKKYVKQLLKIINLI